MTRPLLPRAEALLPYLRRIDEARYYTNHGPLHNELLERLAAHFGISPARLVLANTGTSGLMAALLATAGRATAERPFCICPSFTFVATAVAASACGYTPFLADIDAEDWVLDPGRIAALPAIRQAAAVIAVAPFGRMPPLPPWEDFSRSTGLPVVVDAAACFDSLDPQSLKRSSLTLVLSLHATKTFSTAEGGLVFCPDGATAERVSRALNFGFFNNRESTGPSINGKLSEYRAAIGLAGMDAWQAKRQGFVSAARSYAAQARRHGLEASIIADCRHANPYAVYAAADEPDARRVAAALDGEAIGHRLWYGLGLHHQPEYRAAPREPLPWTARLAPRLIGLPMSCDLAEADVIRVVRTIAAAKEPGLTPPG